jgi:hypothetical protein
MVKTTEKLFSFGVVVRVGLLGLVLRPRGSWVPFVVLALCAVLASLVVAVDRAAAVPATDDGQTESSASASVPLVEPLSEAVPSYTPISPVRVADTRVGQPVAFPAVKTPLAAGGTLAVPVGGVNGVPGDAAAVVANITATGPAGPGHLKVFPCGQARPNASTLNYAAGATVANGTITDLGTEGRICIYSPTQTHLLVDITGYFPAGADYTPISPVRVADTRVGQPVAFPAVKTPLAAGGTLAVPVGGVNGVPGDAAAVVANITATGPAGPGHLKVFPCGQARPNASTLNYPAGATVANGTITDLGTEGRICIYSPARTHLLVDITGYFPTTTPAPVGVNTKIAAGVKHTCAIVAGGQVKCWGGNWDGQLGDGTTTNRSTPVTVSGINGATAITANTSHTCAVVGGGQVKCWGSNWAGQLGDGTTTRRSTPVTVSGINGATALTAGWSHTCAVVGGGQVKCWGWNVYGQLGDGTTTDRSAPVTVSGINGATAITAGGGMGHTCAVVAGGQVKCWGDNRASQLGDGTTTNRSTPVTVSGINGATALASGVYHTCAVVAGGQAKCWGGNWAGQVGDGTTTNRSAPVTVSGINGATALTAGDDHTCVVVAAGQAKCWGSNEGGQLGDGTTTNRSTPVTVAGLVVP